MRSENELFFPHSFAFALLKLMHYGGRGRDGDRIGINDLIER